MRKHFLILMLLTLLPFTASANDLKDCTISVPNVVYGATSFGTPGIQIKYGAIDLIEDTDYSIVDGYFVNATDDTPYMKGAAVATLAQLPVGDYYVKFVGLGGYATTSASKMFSVTGKPLTNAMKSSSAIANQTYTGSAITPATTGRLTDVSTTLVEGTHYTVAYSNNVNAGTATITYTGKGDYSGQISENFTIDPKTLTASMVTEVTLSEVYKGAAFTTFAVDVKDGSTSLIPGTDFLVKAYKEQAFTNYEASPTNVLKYYLAIENKSEANYTLSGKIAAGTFEITKAGLRIAAINQTKKYDGSKSLPESDINKAYTVTGVQGEDALDKIVSSIAVAVDNEDDANIGEKTVVVTSTAYSNTDSKAGNYDVLRVNGKLTIEQLPITIKPNVFKKKFNETDATSSYGFNSDWPADDASTTIGTTSSVKGYLGVTVVETGKTSTPAIVTTEKFKFFGEKKTSGTAANNAGIYVAKKANTPDTKGTHANALEVKVTNTAAPVLANYQITYAEADYQIVGGKIYVTADAKDKIYGEADPEWTCTVDGLSPGDALVKAPTMTRVEGEDVVAGGYTINITGAVAPEGYEDIVYATAKLTIKPRPMTLTAAAQTLAIGKKATDLQQVGYITVSGKAERDAEYTDFKATFNDAQVNEAEAPYALIAAVPHTATGGALDIEGFVKGGVKCVPGANAGTFKATNYAITYVYGDLNVVPATAVVLDDTKDMKTSLDAVKNTSKVVTFTTRALTANSWNVMVLPFDITVSELSQTLGYAVVDVMDQNAEDGNVHFNIYMGTIKANTPFMFKVDGQKTNLTQVAFAAHPIVYDLTNADEDAVQLDATGNSYITDKAGNKLIGTYKTTAINAGEYYLGNVSETPGVVVPGWKPAAAGASPIKGERAILVLNSTSAARILIEEPNGTVTEIETINAESRSVETNGWYTLNGVKLQGMPTQKGIYINNGKKIVIK